MLRNNYQSRNLIGHYPFWVISPRNLTSFTRPFLAGRHAWAGHETIVILGLGMSYSMLVSFPGYTCAENFSFWVMVVLPPPHDLICMKAGWILVFRVTVENFDVTHT